jgi:hypothetical protein
MRVRGRSFSEARKDLCAERRDEGWTTYFVSRGSSYQGLFLLMMRDVLWFLRPLLYHRRVKRQPHVGTVEKRFAHF